MTPPLSPTTARPTVLTAPRESTQRLAAELAGALDGDGVMSPAHLYDARGSELFERITEVDEYYLTRTEAAILQRNADRIIAAARPRELVELGSGSSTKTGALLSAMLAAGTGSRYAALDVSEAALVAAAERLANEHPGLTIDTYVGDFHTDLTRIPHSGRRLLLFLGSTLGNMRPRERRSLLASVARSMTGGDTFLVGIDLVKELDVLLPAYDDAEGVTAAFARNLLAVIDRELDADIPLDAFDYQATWDPAEECVDMRLIATREVVARIGALDRIVTFAPGEGFVTEHSYKFRVDRFSRELADVGLEVAAVHTDPGERFACVLARRVGG